MLANLSDNAEFIGNYGNDGYIKLLYFHNIHHFQCITCSFKIDKNRHSQTDSCEGITE
jgi:hypothetical protein